MSIHIQNRQRSISIKTPVVKKRLCQMMLGLNCAGKELSVVFGSDRLLQELNRCYRHQDHPTNVLAFPQAPTYLGEPDAALLGDVIVSLAVATREADALQQSLEERVVYLLLHGLLHLLGYDHESPAQRRRMEALEKQMLKQCPA